MTVQPLRRPMHPWVLALVGWVWVCVAVGGEVRIDLIEPFLNDKVLIHFDTDANRSYELQYVETGPSGGTWTTLFVAPNIPFPSHYVYPDTRGSRQRFYRLRATP